MSDLIIYETLCKVLEEMQKQTKLLEMIMLTAKQHARHDRNISYDEFVRIFGGGR